VYETVVGQVLPEKNSVPVTVKVCAPGVKLTAPCWTFTKWP